MSIINFPSPLLTPEDEEAIIARVVDSKYCGCRRTTMRDGVPAMALLNRVQQVRGTITKQYGVYAILDPRGVAVTESRKLEDILSVLAT